MKLTEAEGEAKDLMEVTIYLTMDRPDALFLLDYEQHGRRAGCGFKGVPTAYNVLTGCTFLLDYDQHGCCAGGGFNVVSTAYNVLTECTFLVDYEQHGRCAGGGRGRHPHGSCHRYSSSMKWTTSLLKMRGKKT